MLSNFVSRPALQMLKAVAAEAASPKVTVTSIDNHIYFFAAVDSDRCLDLIRTIREVDISLRNQQLSRGIENYPPTPIWLHINSGGGDLFAGFALADQLPLIKSPIYSIVEGLCASAATLLSLPCAKRYILPNSFMLIHQLSSLAWGTHEQFEDELRLQNLMMDSLVRFYASHSKLAKKEIKTILTRESWVSATDALQKGLVDEILVPSS